MGKKEKGRKDRNCRKKLVAIRWPVQQYLFFHSKRNRFEGEDLTSDSTVEIADTDRATYYLRYRHDLCLPTARFSNFVGVPSFREIKEEGALSRKGMYACCFEKMQRLRGGS